MNSHFSMVTHTSGQALLGPASWFFGYLWPVHSMSSLESFLCLSLLPVLNMFVVHEVRLKYYLSQSKSKRPTEVPSTCNWHQLKTWTWHGWCNRFGRLPWKGLHFCVFLRSRVDLHSWVAPARFTDHIYLVVLRRHPSLLDPTLPENTNTERYKTVGKTKHLSSSPLCMFTLFFSEVVIFMYLFLLNFFSIVQIFALLFSDVSIPNSTSKWICWLCLFWVDRSGGIFRWKTDGCKNHPGPAGNETVKISAQPVVMKNVACRQVDQKMMDG